jgi:hypothetical protein
MHLAIRQKRNRGIWGKVLLRHILFVNNIKGDVSSSADYVAADSEAIDALSNVPHVLP